MQPSITREALTRSAVLGDPKLQHKQDPWPRPPYRFSLTLGPIEKTEAERISAEHAFFQGNRDFLWDGGNYGATEGYILAGIGDGRRVDFFLPNRHIGPNSLAVQTLRPSTGATSAWTTQAYSLRAGPGLLSFHPAATPSSGDEIQAKYGCQYLCHFAPDGIAVEQIATDLYLAELSLIENPSIVMVLATAVESIFATVPVPVFAIPPIPAMRMRAMTPLTTAADVLAAQTRFAATMSLSVPMRRVSLDARAAFGAAISIDRVLVGRTTVASGQNEATVTHTLPTTMNISLVPNWNTTWLVTSKSATAINVKFGTEIGSGGGIIEWSIF